MKQRNKRHDIWKKAIGGEKLKTGTLREWSDGNF